MSTFTIKIAERVFSVEAMYPDVERLCADYITESATPEASFTITEEDIQLERRKVAQEAIYEHRPIPLYPAGTLEETAVLRKLAEYLSRNGDTVMHGVLLDYHRRGVLFTAPSGTGKSTHAENWRKVFPECRIINGDKPVIAVRECGVIGYGTPWAGKEGIQINASVPLEAIVFLHRSETNHIEEISFQKSIPMLISCVFRSPDRDGVKRAMMTVSSLNGRLKFYSLDCTMDAASASVACDTIFGNAPERGV